ncbi:MAG: hypothetical protein ABIA02_02370 [Candidatus Falkowbacteria bacterium]
MDDEEIYNLLKSDPDKLFKNIEQKGGSLESLKELKIGRLFAQQRFPELVKQKHLEAVEFMFWFTYFVEREIRDDIYWVEKTLGKNMETIDKKIDGMTFGEKINFIKENYSEDPNNDSYVILLGKIKDLRNHMAHGRLNKLEYGGYFLSDPRGQLKLSTHLLNACLKHEPTM